MLIKRVIEGLGQCENCIKRACVSALAAWLVVGLLYLFESPWAWPYGATVALLFSGLWMAHLVAFGVRTTKGTASVNKEQFSRRKFLGVFFKTAGFAALVSLPMSAHAWSSCGGWHSGDCHPCARRMNANSPCYSCRSCGNNCGDGNC